MSSKKNKKTTKNVKAYFKNLYVAAPLFILILVIVCFLVRGWIRSSVVPEVVSLTYGHSVKTISEKEYSNLNKPFEALGLPDPKIKSDCTLVYAKRFKMVIYCCYSYSSYSDKISGLSPDLGARSQTLAATLKNNGWAGGVTNISTLGQNIRKGIDWTPDAAYMKQIGNTFCLADFNTAFSKPKPPALSGSVSCSRSFQLF